MHAPAYECAETSHCVSHVLLAFSPARNVQWLRQVILPRNVWTVEEFHQSKHRVLRNFNELDEEHQRRFPLKRAKFVGAVYDEASRECTLYYTCSTDSRSRAMALFDFDWLCAWCMLCENLCDKCSAEE